MPIYKYYVTARDHIYTRARTQPPLARLNVNVVVCATQLCVHYTPQNVRHHDAQHTIVPKWCRLC
jgi:hypothetical protein